MEENWEGRPSYEPKPQKHNIAMAMIVGAATLSYLSCVALVGALQKQGVMDPFPQGHDPRINWFLLSFTALMALGFGIYGLARLLGRRKLDEEDFTVETVEERKPIEPDVPSPTEAPK